MFCGLRVETFSKGIGMSFEGIKKSFESINLRVM